VCRRHRATPILISKRSDRRSQVRYTFCITGPTPGLADREVDPVRLQGL
jgi:hypothetical protein